MMNLFVSCSCTITVKHRLWLMSCQRNRTSFVSLELRVSLIWRVLLVWLWRKHRLWQTDFNPLRPFLSSFHTSSSFHSFVSSHTASSSFPRTFSSVFCLSGTCWVYIFSLSLVPLLIIDLVWHFSFPWPSTFFILLEINYYFKIGNPKWKRM